MKIEACNIFGLYVFSLFVFPQSANIGCQHSTKFLHIFVTKILSDNRH